MKKQIQLRAPKSLKDCKPEQVMRWMIIAEHIKDNTENFVKMLEFQAQVVSIFCDITFSQAKNCHVDDLTNVANHLFKMLSDYEYQEPKEEIDICGITYEFDKDVGGWTTGQIIDMKLIEEIAVEPCKALSIMYIEKGMMYCQEDDRGKVLNPNKKREEIFKEYFPADEFLNFFNFFLHESKRRSLAMSSIQILRTMEMKKKMMESLKTQNGTSGLESSSNYLKN